LPYWSPERQPEWCFDDQKGNTNVTVDGSRLRGAVRIVSVVGLDTLARWSEDGYARLDGLLASDECRKLVGRADRLVDEAASGRGPSGAVLRWEDNFPSTLPPVDRVSKLLRIHRDPMFESVFTHAAVLEVIGELVGADVDVFLTQLVFKRPGAYGQPPHQDAPIFPFEPARPVVGVWIALTEATPESSCLTVVRGSHRQPVLDHGRDKTHKTGGRYLALADGAAAGHAGPIELRVGDALVFDSHLVHGSTDNTSTRSRVAVVAHYATAGTVDHSHEVFPTRSFNEWVPVLRNGTRT
jgi:hypothetical protein